MACRVLGVRRQGFYEWCSGVKSPRVQENELLLKHIERIHAESRGTYGWPRVHAELTLGLGLPVNHKRIARLMREAGIQGLYRRRRRGCTVRDLHAEPYVDLVDRDFVVDGPDEIWCTDVTEHPTREGKVYCAAVIDVFSRRVVGWSIGDNMRTELVIDALGMAVIRRCPDRQSTILHSDHGSQPGLNRSSQHLECEVRNGTSSWLGCCGDGSAGDAVSGKATDRPRRTPPTVLVSHRPWCDEYRRGGRGRRVARRRDKVVPRAWRSDTAVGVYRGVRTLPVVCRA